MARLHYSGSGRRASVAMDISMAFESSGAHLTTTNNLVCCGVRVVRRLGHGASRRRTRRPLLFRRVARLDMAIPRVIGTQRPLRAGGGLRAVDRATAYASTMTSGNLLASAHICIAIRLAES